MVFHHVLVMQYPAFFSSFKNGYITPYIDSLMLQLKYQLQDISLLGILTQASTRSTTKYF